MSIDRDPTYLHPVLAAALPALLSRLTRGTRTAKLLSAHRTPAEQLELFKRGRALVDGKLVVVKKSEVVTHNDGTAKPSRHNYLPALAMDIGLFDGGRYLTSAADYTDVGPAARTLGLEWGGDWTRFKDAPHVQLPASRLVGGVPEREAAAAWQRLLQLSGQNVGLVDGYFGEQSRSALRELMGSDERSAGAWKSLVERFGTLSVA